MDKDYSKYFAPSLKDARKRINTITENIYYQLPQEIVGLGNDKTYMIKTFGCQANSADSEKIAGILEALGFLETEDEEKADFLLFNTCAIRENAEDRAFGELGRVKKFKRTNPNKIIGLCGCMPQEENVVKRVREKIPHVDLVFGTHNIHKLGEYLQDVMLSKERVVEVYSKEGDIIEDVPTKRANEHKAWVNIMYGCDEFCTYCIVPYTRGKERSRLPQEIIREVESLVKEGYSEVTLLGQNVNAYGKDFKDIQYGFADLLKNLQSTTMKRVRFMTSHPRDLDEETMQAMAIKGNIMPHLHLPVQSGSNTVLKKMNRKYTKESYLEKIERLRSLIPDISITTDIIVGFPNETEEDFMATIDLIENSDFEGAYTFIFSPREGTPAAKYEDSIPEEVKKERLQRLNKRINEGFAKGNKRFEGQVVSVLVEGKSFKKDKMLSGYSEHNKVVNFLGDDSLIGNIVDVFIEKAYTWHLKGKQIKKDHDF